MSLPTPERAPSPAASHHRPAWARWPAFALRTHTLRWRGHGGHGGWLAGAQAWPTFEAWCQAHPGQRCTLLLGAALLHETLADAALPLANDAAALAWAGPLLQYYHGEAAAAWPLAAWQAGQRRGVSALHGASLAALQATANAHGVRLLRVQAEWPQRLQQALAADPALHGEQARLLLPEPGWVVVLDLQHGQLTGLQLRRTPSNGTADEAEACAPWMADHSNAWVWTAGASSGDARGSPWRAALQPADFLRPQRGLHRLAWPAAATALLVLGLAAAEAQDAWAARATARQALWRAQGLAGGAPAAKLAHQRATGPASAASTAPAPAETLAAAARADRLNRPWPAVFQALDAAQRPGVVWLGLQVAESGALRLQGQAAATASALAAAEALAQAGGLQAVLPGRVETTPGGGATFDVQAQAAPPWR